MKTILSIVGARPQFVKAAVVTRALASRDDARQVLVHTGQHFDENMSEVFFREMRIPDPDYHLNIGGVGHGAMTGRMLEKIEEVILREQPDAVLVYGDTNSTLAGALAAAKLHVPLAHVEAGLRSFNMQMPEEINRTLTDRISKWLFCPTDSAMANLQREGLTGPSAGTSDPRIAVNVGDVMYDAAIFYRNIAQASEPVASLIVKLASPFFLATVHRAENTDDKDRLGSIIGALDEISRSIPVVLPLHPRTRKKLGESGIAPQALRVIEPVGYFDMIALLASCQGVFTDSGGVQKEAYFFRRRCVTLRDETEWVELVDHGFNVLVGANRASIIQAAHTLNGRPCDFSAKLYGSGRAGEDIVRILVEGLS